MYKELQDAEWLKNCYFNKNMSGQAIADIVGCSKYSVYRALKRHDIKGRPHTSKFPMLNDKEWLRTQYVDKGRSTNDIAREVGSSSGNITDHLKTMGLERRGIKAAVALASPDGTKGDKSPTWKGGIRKAGRTGYLYQYAPDHPNATKKGYVMQHRLVAESIIDRHLTSDEIVHHIDGNRSNNDPTNLEVLTRSEHVTRHFEDGSLARKLEEENDNLRKELADCKRKNRAASSRSWWN